MHCGLAIWHILCAGGDKASEGYRPTVPVNCDGGALIIYYDRLHRVLNLSAAELVMAPPCPHGQRRRQGHASFFLVERGEMRQAPCVGLQYGLPVGLLARWTNLPLDLPTKTLLRR